MKELKFTIPGIPQQKKSPKLGVNKKSGRAFAFPDSRNISRKKEITTYALEAGWSGPPHEGPVSLKILAVFPIPKSFPKYKKEKAAAGRLPVIKKPDGDRIMNSIQDSLEGIAWKNDSQIYAGRWLKRYGNIPRMEVTIRFIDE